MTEKPKMSLEDIYRIIDGHIKNCLELSAGSLHEENIKAFEQRAVALQEIRKYFEFYEETFLKKGVA